MPVLRVTTGASAFIARSVRAGKTAREIAELIEQRFGLRLNHTTISRHARAIGGDVAVASRARSKRARRAVALARGDAPLLAAMSLDVPAGADDVSVVRWVVRALFRLLAESGLSAESHTMLRRELAETVVALGEDGASLIADENEPDDVAFMIAATRRFAGRDYSQVGPLNAARGRCGERGEVETRWATNGARTVGRERRRRYQP